MDINIRRLKSKGAGGIRTHGGVTHDGFQDRCINPLCHGSIIVVGLSWYPANIFQSNKVIGIFFDRCPTPRWYFLDRRPMTSQVLFRQVPYHLEDSVYQTHEPSCYQPIIDMRARICTLHGSRANYRTSLVRAVHSACLISFRHVCVYIFRHRIVNEMGRAGVEPATPGFSVPCSTS